MTQRNLVSVCVPAFDRPEMTMQLIASFLKQSYVAKELVISDDSPNERIRDLVNGLCEPSIKYFKNPHNLGYSRNLLRSMELAQGDFIILMGDDDAFLTRNALARYASVFIDNPTVGYVYSNQVQFSNRVRVQAKFQFFQTDKCFSKGEDSMRNTWMTSVFIPGLAIRKGISTRDLYPSADMLFPQVELVGSIVNQSESYGIEECLIAGRAHREQLGFYAIKGERIKGPEKHGTTELFAIFERLSQQYCFSFTNDFLVVALVNRYALMMLKERTIIPRSKVHNNYTEFCAMSPEISRSKKLKLSYWAAMILPSTLINLVRVGGILVVRLLHWREFSIYERELRESMNCAGFLGE